MTPAELPGLSPPAAPGETAFNPFDPQFSADPYPFYAHLRRQPAPFAIRGCLGHDWIVTRHAHAREVLQNDGSFAIDDLPSRIRESARRVGDEASVDCLCRALDAWLFFINSPEHEAIRRILAPAFGKNAVRALRESISARARALTAAALKRGAIDVIADLARPLPAFTAAALLDCQDAAADNLAEIGNRLFGVFTQPLSLKRYQVMDRELRASSELFLAESPVPRGESGLRSLLQQAERTGEIDRRQLLGLCAMIASVGQDTTQNLIGNCVNALLDHPQQLRLLCDRPDLLAPAVRELARFDSPVQLVLRIARAQVELGGASLPAGARVHIFLGAALRDGMAYPDPDDLIFSREQPLLLPYGAGIHFCLGFRLAQLQAEAALDALLPHLLRLRRAAATPPRMRSVHMRGLTALVLTGQ